MHEAVFDKMCAEVLSYQQPIMMIHNLPKAGCDSSGPERFQTLDGRWTTLKDPMRLATSWGTTTGEGRQHAQTLFQNEILRHEIAQDPPIRDHSRRPLRLSIRNDSHRQRSPKPVARMVSGECLTQRLSTRRLMKRRGPPQRSPNQPINARAFMLGFRTVVQTPVMSGRVLSHTLGPAHNSRPITCQPSSRGPSRGNLLDNSKGIRMGTSTGYVGLTYAK